MTAIHPSSAPTTQPESVQDFSPSWSLSYATYHTAAAPILRVSYEDTMARAERTVLKETAARIGPLLGLMDGWDGARAQPIDQVCAIRAIQLVGYLASDVLLVPQVFPLPDGGIQLEWRINGDGLEIEISPLGEINALGVHADGSIGLEVELGSDAASFSVARRYLQDIGRPLVG